MSEHKSILERIAGREAMIREMLDSWHAKERGKLEDCTDERCTKARDRAVERIAGLECALEAERHEHHPSDKAWAYFCWPARWYARSLKVAEPSAERSARLLGEVQDAE